MRFTLKTCVLPQHCVLVPTEDLQSPWEGGGGFAWYLQRFKTTIMKKGEGKEHFTEILKSASKSIVQNPKQTEALGRGHTRPGGLGSCWENCIKHT